MCCDNLAINKKMLISEKTFAAINNLNLYCIKCSKFRKNNKIKIKQEIHGKINLYSRCTDHHFKTFATCNKEELGDVLKV